MIPVAALVSAQSFSAGKPMAGAGEMSLLLPQAAPGQVMSARVDAVLPDGKFRVVVAGQEMSMALPKYFAPGDSVELTFLGREPRLTFSLNQGAPTASGPAPVLSDASRLVATLLPRPGEAATPATISNAAPLMAAAPEDGAALSAKLQGILTQSGLFYESHQAEWVAGRRDLAVLMREPQARIEPRSATTAQQPAPQAQQPAALAAVQNSATGIAVANDATSGLAAVRSDQTMPQQVQTLVQQQLAALETGKLVFQLQVWPDQWMRWEVDEDAQNADTRSGAGAVDPLQSFQTRLHLELPRLGTLDATLTFDATGVRVRLDAAQPSSADLLQDHRASLRAALADAGVPAADIAVTRHGQA